MPLANYSPLHGLPPLAGVADFTSAMKPGLSIDDCVDRLKRHHWAFRRLHEIFIQRLTAEPIYELKMAFKVLIDWQSYRKKGLTQHENWWPALYREWCRVRNCEPDPAVLAYATTYETARADLIERGILS